MWWEQALMDSFPRDNLWPSTSEYHHPVLKSSYGQISIKIEIIINIYILTNLNHRRTEMMKRLLTQLL